MDKCTKEDETSVENNYLLDAPTDCPAPELCALAKGAGISCQRLFERSYVQLRQSDSFGRAVFAQYIHRRGNGRALPEIVRSYAAKLTASRTNGNDEYKRGFCSGCMLNGEGIAGLAYAYELIHPECLVSDLQAKPENIAADTSIELLYDKMLSSGLLDEDQDDIATNWENDLGGR